MQNTKITRRPWKQNSYWPWSNLSDTNEPGSRLSSRKCLYSRISSSHHDNHWATSQHCCSFSCGPASISNLCGHYLLTKDYTTKLINKSCLLFTSKKRQCLQELTRPKLDNWFLQNLIIFFRKSTLNSKENNKTTLNPW